jgi:hypothetical protein
MLTPLALLKTALRQASLRQGSPRRRPRPPRASGGTARPEPMPTIRWY